MKKGQYSVVAANAKVLMRLIGLDHQQINHNVGLKHRRSTTYFNGLNGLENSQKNKIITHC